MLWLALGAIAAGLLLLAWRVWCGDFDGTPYPALNGTKLEQAIREARAQMLDDADREAREQLAKEKHDGP